MTLLVILSGLPPSVSGQTVGAGHVGTRRLGPAPERSAPESFAAVAARRAPEFAPGEVIVSYLPGTPAAAREQALAQIGLSCGRQLRLAPDLEVVSLPQGLGVLEAVSELRRLALVRNAQPNYRHRPATPVSPPNDPRFGELWGLDNPDGTGIDILTAWSDTRGDPSVIVAVIDTGVDTNHPDLLDNIWVNPGETGPGASDGVDDDGNGYVDDTNGWDFASDDGTVYDAFDNDNHGTHVAGTIAAVADNDLGVAGVAPNVTIIPLKFFGGPDGGGWTDDAVEAIYYAIDKGARVINASWGGGGGEEPVLKNAIEDFGLAGGLFVCSAGNEGLDNDYFRSYPSSYDLPNIIAVAATDSAGQLAGFSNYGLETVDVGAPGVDILSTLPRAPQAPAAVASPNTMFWGFGAEGFGSNTDALLDAVGRAVTSLGLGPDPSLLVVHDDQCDAGWSAWPDVKAYYLDSLATLGYTYSTTDILTDQDGPTAEEMAGYDAVVWFTGGAWGGYSSLSLTENDLANLAVYLGGGGKLFLSGRDAIYGNEFAPFVTDDLHVLWLAEWTGVPHKGLIGVGGEYADPDYPALPADYTGLWAGDIYHDFVMPADAEGALVLEYVEGSYDDGYGYYDGTSMASPHVAGLAALLFSREPAAPLEWVTNRILTTTKTLPSLEHMVMTGGLVNAGTAVAYPTDIAVTSPPRDSAVDSTPPEFTVRADSPYGIAGVTFSYREWSDSAGVWEWVEISADTEGDGSGDYTADWGAKSPQDGIHLLRAVVTDGNGAELTARVSVAVDTEAPWVSILEPSDGAYLNELWLIYGQAGDAAAVDSVELDITRDVDGFHWAGEDVGWVDTSLQPATEVWLPAMFYTYPDGSAEWGYWPGSWLEDGNTYTLTARVADRSGHIVLASPVRFTYDLQAPATPKHFHVGDWGDGETLLLTWAPNGEPDLAGYNVYRSATEGGEYELVNGDGPIAGPTYLDTPPVSAGRSWHGVTAVDLAGNESAMTDPVGRRPSRPGGGGSGGSGSAGDTGQSFTLDPDEGGTGEAGRFGLKAPAGVLAGTPEGSSLVVIVTELDSAAAKAALRDAAPPAGFTAIEGGFRLEAFLEDGGGRTEVTSFDRPIVIRIELTAEELAAIPDPEKVGLFRVGEDGTLVFAGGRLIREGPRSYLAVQLWGFSTYVLGRLDVNFLDLTGHWAKKDVELMAAKGIVKGLPDGGYNPGGQVTRAEFACLLARALNLRPDAVAPLDFTDVKTGDWFFAELGAAVKAKLITGFDDGTFRPNAPVTREQVAAMIGRAIVARGAAKALSPDEVASALRRFGDRGNVSAWARGGVALAIAEGIMTGLSGQRLEPGAGASRAEAAVMMARLWRME